MASGYSLHRLDLSNYPLLVPLMKDSFGVDASAAYFKWKYFENPAGTCVGFLALDNKTNECVAFYGAIPQVYTRDGEEMIIYQACDTMTHTRHRKKSLFPILAQECYRYLKEQNLFFMIGIGGSERSLPVLAHFGWRTIFRFRNYFRPRLFCRLSFLKRYPSGKFARHRDINPILHLIGQQIPSGVIHGQRSPQQYAWRVQNPDNKYEILTYQNRNEISGYIIYYILYNRIYLFDFSFSDKRSGNALFWYLSREVVKQKYQGIMSFSQENGIHSRLLRKKGFVSNPFSKGPLSVKPPFLIYSDTDTMHRFMQPGQWHITAYDHDAL